MFSFNYTTKGLPIGLRRRSRQKIPQDHQPCFESGMSAQLVGAVQSVK